MTNMICWLIGCLLTISIYLTLSTQMMRWLFGIVILSSTINLIIFVAGRLNSSTPAFIPEGKQVSETIVANPLPQALILTAIVIGFGLLAFSLVLVRRIWRTFHTIDMDLIRYSETHHLKNMDDDV